MKLTLKDIKKSLSRRQSEADSNKSNRGFSHFDVRQSVDLAEWRVCDGLCYIPGYIDADLEGNLVDEILDQSPTRWVQVRGRRLQMWGGQVISTGLTDPETLPIWLDIFAQRLFHEGIFPYQPNHVLINDYQPGEGIMAHTDGPAYYPQVAILSLNSPTVFQFWTKERNPYVSLYAEPRSLLLFSGEFYTDLLHSVEAKPFDAWLEDDCGKVFTEVAGRISEVKNTLERLRSQNRSDFPCPQCGNGLWEAGGNVRGRRVALTIRFVPPSSVASAP